MLERRVPLREEARITSLLEVRKNTFLLKLRAPQISKLALPGQFVLVRCSHLPLRRPMSIAGRRGEEIHVLFDVVGRGTAWLAGRKEGEEIDLMGPLGRPEEIPKGRILFIAGGIGLAPLLFLAEEAKEKGRDALLVIGIKGKEEIFPDFLLPGGVRVLWAAEDGSLDFRGTALDLSRPHLRWADFIFACGPSGMYKALLELVRAEGLEGKFRGKIRVFLEQVMGCGVGACLGCSIPTIGGMKTVCRDGPAFDLFEVKWEEVPPPSSLSSLSRRAPPPTSRNDERSHAGGFSLSPP